MVQVSPAAPGSETGGCAASVNANGASAETWICCCDWMRPTRMIGASAAPAPQAHKNSKAAPNPTAARAPVLTWLLYHEAPRSVNDVRVLALRRSGSSPF